MYIYKYIHTYKYIYICMCVCIYIYYIYIYVHMCMYACIYILYIYILYFRIFIYYCLLTVTMECLQLNQKGSRLSCVASLDKVHSRKTPKLKWALCTESFETLDNTRRTEATLYIVTHAFITYEIACVPWVFVFILFDI